MAITIDHLHAYLRQYFAEKLPVTGDGAPGSVVLVFDALGRPMPTSEFMGAGTTGVPDVLAHQRAADLADQLPARNALTSGSYLARAGSRLSRLYEAMIMSGVPTSTDQAALTSFEAGRSRALSVLENNKLAFTSGTVAGGISGTVPAPGILDYYYATGMSPVDWYSAAATYWQSYQLDAANAPPLPPPVTGTPPVTSAPQVILPPVSYQVADDDFLVLMVEEDPEGPSPCPVEIDQLGLAASEVWQVKTGATQEGLDVAVRERLDAVGGARLRGTTGRTYGVLRDLGITAVPSPWVGQFDALAARAGLDLAELQAQPVEEVFTNDALMRRLLPDDALVELGRSNVGPELDVLADALRAHAVLAEAIDQKPVAARITSPEVIAAATESVPAAAANMHVSFQYCLVQFDRPWWDELFVGRRGWALPGYKTGEISSGSLTKPTGPVTLLTIGMLVVRKLVIRATWTDADRSALSRAVSLGPFSLAGSAFDAASGRIVNEGMQAVGWLCQVPPVLPP